jgi:receptor protein-tyrosine kinase
MRVSRGESDLHPLRAALDALWRRKWLAVEVVLLGALLGAVLALKQHRVYEGTATAHVAASVKERQSRHDLRLARSWGVLDALARAAPARGLDLGALAARTSVVSTPRSDTLEFHARDASPARAAALATAYVRAFAEAHRRRGELLVASEGTDVRPAAGAEQVSPRPFRTIGFGSLFGALGAIALIFGLERFDRRVRSSREVSRALDLPLLAALVPRGRASGAVGLDGMRYGEEAEVFRILRTNVELALVDPPARVIMVTSAIDGEGRTHTAANLAAACAVGGRRVALVDLHLRYPGLARLFDLEGHPGLTDVVLQHVPLKTALRSVELESDDTARRRPPLAGHGELAVLTAGPEPIDTADVVASPLVGGVIDILRKRYDLVVLDAPPLLPVADARILGGVADALVVVANLSLLRRPMLQELKSAVRACGTTPIGVFVTDASRAQHDAYAGYYYSRRPWRAMPTVARGRT